MDETIAQQELEDELSEEDSVNSELDLPIWSVIGFDASIASSLTYQEAVELMAVKNKESHRGLCIVTDEAAARFTYDD